MSKDTESTNISIVIAILVVTIAAAWLGYAYYRGPSYKTADGGNILLLHTIVPIALIILLLKLRQVNQVKDAIYIIIAPNNMGIHKVSQYPDALFVGVCLRLSLSFLHRINAGYPVAKGKAVTTLQKLGEDIGGSYYHLYCGIAFPLYVYAG